MKNFIVSLNRRIMVSIVVVMAAAIMTVSPVRADTGLGDMQVYVSSQKFDAFLERLKTSISEEKMGVVAEACADCGARSIGIEIPGNRVVMVFNPHFAVRMLKANIDAGIEAPLRLYVTETPSGIQLSYRKPSAVFAPYASSGDLVKLANELDIILEKIAKRAVQ